jgi:NADH-quinone oxidoreductase subunit L
MIIWQTWTSGNGSPGLWIFAILGVVLTSLYTFRLIFIVFYGEPMTHVEKRPGWAMAVPVVVLSALSIVGGFVKIPFSDFLHTALPPLAEVHTGAITESISELSAAGAFILGFLLAYVFYFRKYPAYTEALTANALGRALHKLWFADWGFDWLYDRVFVRPVVWFAQADKNDLLDKFYNGLARVCEMSWKGLRLTETGRLRWYAACIAGGSVLFLAIELLT